MYFTLIFLGLLWVRLVLRVSDSGTTDLDLLGLALDLGRPGPIMRLVWSVVSAELLALGHTFYCPFERKRTNACTYFKIEWLHGLSRLGCNPPDRII